MTDCVVKTSPGNLRDIKVIVYDVIQLMKLKTAIWESLGLSIIKGVSFTPVVKVTSNCCNLIV